MLVLIIYQRRIGNEMHMNNIEQKRWHEDCMYGWNQLLQFCFCFLRAHQSSVADAGLD